jgi:type IV pilus assembly protein PilX
MNKFTHKIKSQSGTVIMIGLVFMLVMTLIAITSMNHATLSELMASNDRQQMQAFQASESALKGGESWLQNQSTPPDESSTCSSPPCLVWQSNILSQIWTQPHSWWTTQGTQIATSINGVSTQPVYIIESESFVPYELSPDARSKGMGYYFYRVTSKGTGGTDNANAIVESIYATQFN